MVGILSAMILAMDPYLIFFCHLILTETLFIFFFCLTAFFLWHLLNTPATAQLSCWFFTGLLLAVCTYFRPIAIGFWPPFLFLIILRHQGHRKSLLGAFLLVLILISALFPWAWRNQKMTGQWLWLTNRLGYTLWDGLRKGADGSTDTSEARKIPGVQGLNEIEWNQFFLKRALRDARENPLRVFQLALVKMKRTWSIIPHWRGSISPIVVWLSGFWYTLLYIFTVLGLYHLRKSPWILFFCLIPILTITLFHSIFPGSIRYRLPAMPFVAILAAFGISKILEGTRFSKYQKRVN